MTVDEVIATIDARRFAELVARWGGNAGPADERRQKYLDLPRWIDANLQRAQRLELCAGPPRRVLDLGCGCGYFVHICKLLGHDAIGIDRRERASLFTDVRGLLGVRAVDHTIRPFEPLPELGRFDVVTAHMVTFNGHRTKPWGAAEWAWLLDELAAPVVYLELNAEPDGTLYPPGVRELFTQRSATIDAHRVLLRR